MIFIVHGEIVLLIILLFSIKNTYLYNLKLISFLNLKLQRIMNNDKLSI